MSQSRKTFIGTILSVTQSKIVMSSKPVGGSGGEPIALTAGAVVLEQARSLIGRTVRYTAELDASTSELTRPQFVIGSEYGLRAQVVMRERCAPEEYGTHRDLPWANEPGETFDRVS